MTKTKIEWADRVWNPVTGCSKVSEGCQNCYAERIAQRFWGERRFEDVRCHEDRLHQPMRWKKPARVFVNSMSDLFHPDVPDGFIFGCFMRMAHKLSTHHTFIILTKRPERMMNWIKNNWMKDMYGDFHPGLALDNVWLGVSVENQATADERIPLLLQTPAAKRVVSYEPALGPVDLQISTWFRNLNENKHNLPPNGIGLDWLIMGGESGPNTRPMHPDWARSVRDQCQAAGVPFFLKQMHVDGKLVKMPELDGKAWNEVPE